MTYIISEADLGRQRLLNKIAAPLTDELLDHLNLDSDARCLDLGCGIGETTLSIAKRIGPSGYVVGIDLDPALIEQAKLLPATEGAEVKFEVGDASQLDFPEGSFDFVFARFLLVHVPAPLELMAAMFRLCRPGGIVAVQDGIYGVSRTSPPNHAWARINELWVQALPSPDVGMQLLDLMKKCGAEEVAVSVDTGFEYGGHLYFDYETVEGFDGAELRRFYRMTTEAMATAFVQMGLASETEMQEICTALNDLEESPDVEVMVNPMVSVYARKD